MRVLAPVLLVAGCATNLVNPLELDATDEAREVRPIGPAHGVENEQVEYEVRLRGFLVGRVQVAVGDRGVFEGRPAVIVRSRMTLAGLADTFGTLDWEMTSTVDIDSGCSVREEEQFTVKLAGKEKHGKEARTMTVAQCHRNVHAAAGALRGWRSRQGMKASLEVRFDQHSMGVEITDAAREVVGTMPAVRYDGTWLGGQRKVSAWLSDDDARVPLKLESESKLGTIEVTMINYDVRGE